MTRCIYCSEVKKKKEMSLEHIWPDALGGDNLPELWKTENVCRRCNNLCGLFVDGEFIRGMFGTIERSSTRGIYVEDPNSSHIVLPLSYLGRLKDIPIPKDHIAEYWTGPCGPHVIHIRNSDQDRTWDHLASGDPRNAKNRNTAGRVYVNMTSSRRFWVASYIASVKSHFKNADCFLVNVGVEGGPIESLGFLPLDTRKQPQSEDMRTVTAVQYASRDGKKVHSEFAVREDFERRLLAKVALSLGHQILGNDFLKTEYAQTLRTLFREADHAKRTALRTKGWRYFSSDDKSVMSDVLAFPGAWLLFVQALFDQLLLVVITPTQNVMSIVVCEDPRLVRQVMSEYGSGMVWLTIPSLRSAVGPLSLPEYLAHQIGNVLCPELADVSRKWTDFSTLPPC